jgi:probable rRNA maturation factor
MNSKYLNHKELTDVITFNLSNIGNELKGEVYISIDRVKENAKMYGEKTSNETRRVIIHGLLHLLGFDDKTVKEKKEMKNQENINLQNFEKYLIKHKNIVSRET